MPELDHTGLMRLAIQSAAAGVHVAYPATVVSYDSGSQKAKIRIVPAFRRYDPEQGGALVTYRPPDVPGVPVAFPGAGAFSVAWPLAAGDSGLLIVTSRSMDEWLSGGGTTSEPQDPRRHDITDSVFIPGLRSFAATEVIPATGVSASALVVRGAQIQLGDSTASDFVALASLVLAELNSLYAQLAAHTHTTGIGPTSPPVGVAVPPNSVAATAVKAL